MMFDRVAVPYTKRQHPSRNTVEREQLTEATTPDTRVWAIYPRGRRGWPVRQVVRKKRGKYVPATAMTTATSSLRVGASREHQEKERKKEKERTSFFVSTGCLRAS